MNVALVTPELYSLIRRSNLASIAESLAHSLLAAGNRVRVFIPRSAEMDHSLLSQAAEVGQVTIEDPIEGPIAFTLLEVFIGKLPVIIIDQPRFFNERNPYGDETGPYQDNWHRYALFSRAVLEALNVVKFSPRVIHCMDWSTGLIPVIHELEYRDIEGSHAAKSASTWFSIHNLAIQGIYERNILSRIGLPNHVFKEVDGIAHEGKVNFLKAGAEFATVIGTHSLAHADRIRQKDRGHGLEALFNRRAKDFIGIHNGIDYQAWDPTSDPALVAHFSAKDKEPTKAKLKCKAALQKAFGLDNGPRQPVACIIGHWDANNGFDLLANSFPDLLERGLQMILLGTGPTELTKKLKTLEVTFAGRIKIIEGFTPYLAHQIMGGADILMMPSHYQPANPLFAIAMRYGVTPFVYSKGGLEDKVIDMGDSELGTGFHFTMFTPDGLLEGIDKVLGFYKNADDWKALVKRCLEQDFSWEQTAEQYTKAYRRLARRPRRVRSVL